MMNIIRCSLVFISLLLHIFGEPTPIGFNGNSAAGSLGGGSLSAPSFSQELLEPCVSILDVFEFLAVDDAICSGLARAGQLRVWCLRSYSIFRDGTTWQGCHIPNCKSKIICKGLLSCLVDSYHSDSSCNFVIEWPGHMLMLFRSILLSFGITG